MTKRKQNKQTEGRAEYFMDVDRMINEGLGGGTVSDTEVGMIGETHELEKEDPPNKSKDPTRS